MIICFKINTLLVCTIIFTFDLFQTLLVIVTYLQFASNLGFFIPGSFRIKVFQIMYKFILVEGELRKPTVAQLSNFFFTVAVDQKKEIIVLDTF